MRYIRRLALVLRQRKGETIPRPKETIPPDKLSPHYTPTQLAELLDKHWHTVRKLLNSGALPHIKHSSKDYQVHVDFLPAADR